MREQFCFLSTASIRIPVILATGNAGLNYTPTPTLRQSWCGGILPASKKVEIIEVIPHYEKISNIILIALFSLSGVAYAQTTDTTAAAPTETSAQTTAVTPSPAVTAPGQAVKEIEARIKALNQEMEARIKTIREEYKRRIETLRKEAKAKMETAKAAKKEVKQTIKTERKEVKQNIQEKRQEVRKDIQTQRQEVKTNVQTQRQDLRQKAQDARAGAKVPPPPTGATAPATTQ